MKKYLSIVLTFLCLLSCLTACGKQSAGPSSQPSNTQPSGNEDAKQLQVVTTIFPEYDWVREIMGSQADSAQITMLLDNGTDLHSYQPTAEDILKISTCDLFIYVGGESDEWVEDALREATNKDMKVINLLETLGDQVKTEEMVEGMQESEHDHDHGGEFEESDIQDRTLSEFAGEWISLYPLLLDGKLDEYLEHKAEDDETATAETYREKYTASWVCEADHIAIAGDTITFTYQDGHTVSADYQYAGYAVKRADDGSISNVRYQFQTDNAAAPRYVQFNDHGHEPGEVEHFHIYFGNDGFDALTNSKTNPYFMPAALSTEEILEELTGHDHHHEEEADEHVWLSLKNAQALCGAITNALAEIDPDNAASYQANNTAYCAKLSSLDGQYQAAVDAATQKTILFGDRFPFRYLVDYGLSYYAAFVGCSAETEASFETVMFLAGKVDELGLNSVCTIEKSDQKIAQTIVQSIQKKNQQILTMDSMQSTTSQDVSSGANYLSIMEGNLETLKDALK